MIDQNYARNVLGNDKIAKDILDCVSKDAQGLNDFQQLATDGFIEIPRVGINGYRLPIEITNKFGETRSHDCKAAMYINLEANKNGLSMSRLVSILQGVASTEKINVGFFKTILRRYRNELADQNDKHLISNAYLNLNFQYPIKQKSLKSDNWGWQYYPVSLKAKETKEDGFEYFMTMTYEYSSTCPCSLSMAKQYERDFAAGKTTEGVGIGVAHSQRSKMTVTVKLQSESPFYIEDLLMLIKTAIPTETQSLVKRVDEQAFAILNGTNPIFVEHASTLIANTLNTQPTILDWLVEIEHIESLHSHNAVAVIYKGIENGLRDDTIF